MPASSAGAWHQERADWICAKGLPVALSISAVLWLGPYWAWETPLLFRLSVAFVTLVFAMTLGSARTTWPTRNIVLALFLLVLFLYFGSHRNAGPFVLSSGWLVLLVFVLADDRTKRASLRYFTIAFAITLIPGLVVLTLSALGIDVPWHALSSKQFDFDLLLGNRAGFFRAYPGSVVLDAQVIPFGPGSIFRLQGMYNEPGVVGTFCALLLAAGGMRIKGHRYHAVLLVAGLLSFSLAFYVITFVYFLLRRPITTLAVTGSVTWAVLSTALANAYIVQLYFVSRFALADGKFRGDNRVTGLFAALYEDFWNADLLTRLFGSPHDVAILVNTGNFSYKVLVYAYGLVGVAALVTFLVMAATSASRGKAAFTLLAVFLLSIYQRPDVLMLPYFLVLLGGVARLRHAAHGTWEIARHSPAPR